ncbi:MAG TPA: aspartate aminotransferase family protein [Candidatus Sulfotelmatobacter sp.]|jgi:acetylornithine/LysW-gamma-L-lysine aminotransferase|nr:aspartate aminotransferase family protein [Candidatus Sulfotelmatobacter sp.]
MNEKEIIDSENHLMANVFSKKPVVLTRGKGAVVWDVNGKEYIDCTSGYGVGLLGHCHPKIVDAICKQAQQLITCHAGYYNDKRTEFLQKLTEITPKDLNKAFLSNSGAESVECALKLARKHMGKPEIIAVMGAFHGKTMGALSVTWDKKYREPFLPLVPEIKHVPPDNLEKMRDAISEKTAAVLVEPIRGEGGIRVPPSDYLRGLRELCNEKGILLMFDEVQTGFGRTGKLFACQHWDVTPDVMCLAKPLAGGLPLGATVAREEIMSSFKVGDHSTTFSGNPLVCAAGCAAIDVLTEEKVAEHAAELGAYFKTKLEELQAKHKSVKEVRGLGLMLGMESRFDVLNILLKSIDRNVLVLDAGKTVVRFLPPFVINKSQINIVVTVLDSILEEEENARSSSTSPN